MSTWSFLGEFYKRVELAHEYAYRLENDLRRAESQAQQYNATITRYEHSLSVVNSRLNDTLKSLESEKKNHAETARLFEIAYEACTENTTIANDLRAQISDLQQGLALITPALNDQVHELELPNVAGHAHHAALYGFQSLPRDNTPMDGINLTPDPLQYRRLPPRPSRASSVPPGLNSLDHSISFQNGSTSVFELTARQLQSKKYEATPNLMDRVEELTREAGYLRQELKFYRQCFDNSQHLRGSFYNAYQELFFMSTPMAAPDLQKLIVKLHDALEDSIEKEVKAEKEWKEFWGLKCTFEELRGGSLV
ncbi:hypothetical protein V501_00015 [Pseudogymnoascus sp. VKM F-4519 (FW-2642)]|nr:hypothetical protein V501_00015 [Pseudogymnoascus sp. VKM F-4519 (FW-2642)]